ncbi:hypothetical protein EON62_05715, partial [archaeon]
MRVHTPQPLRFLLTPTAFAGGLYSVEKLTQLLGFKFSHFTSGAATTATPAALCRVAAALVIQGAINLRQLWIHLSPSAETILTGAKAITAAYKAVATKFKDVRVAAMYDAMMGGLDRVAGTPT